MRPAVLVQPPVFDPYAPLLSVPALSAALKADGRPCVPLDLNLELVEALATEAGIASLRGDFEAERALLLAKAQAGALRPSEAQAALGRHLLDRPDLASALAESFDVLREPAMYRFAGTSMPLASSLGPWHGVAGLLAIAPAPFSGARAQDLLAGREALPYLSWLREVGVPRLLALDPAWVGLSVTFEQQLLPTLVLGGLLREAGVPVFAGGFHLSTVGASGLLDDRDLFDLVDGVMVGEADLSVLDLDTAARDGSLADVPGLVWRDGVERLANKPVTRPDLGALAVPDLESMPLGRYLAPATILPYQVSRGCYFGKCTFCNFTAVSPGYRTRPMDQVLDDLERLAELGQAVNFTMEAELPQVCRALSEGMIERRIPLVWEMMVRLDRGLTGEILELMAQAGCRTLFFGLESGASRVNALMHKAVSGPVAKTILQGCAAAGINVVLSGIRGFPGESAVEEAQTAGFYRWARDAVGDRILVSGGMHEFRLTRASPIWDDPAAFGIRPTRLDEVGPLAVSTPYEHTVLPVFPSDGMPASAGREREPLVTVEELEELRFGPMPLEERRGPQRTVRTFSHDLLRLLLEVCNPQGFRHQAIASRALPPPPPQGRPGRFALDAAAVIAPQPLNPKTGGLADQLHCLQPAYHADGVLVPTWFEPVLRACAGPGGLGLPELTEAVERFGPAGGPPPTAWLGRLLPALFAAGVLREAAGAN